MIRTVSTIAACALGTSILAAAAMQSGQQRPQDRPSFQERESEITTLEGKIVDLYHFMKASDEDRKNLKSAAYNERATGGPLALVVMRDRTAVTDTQNIYMILGAPDEPGRPSTQPGEPGQQREMQMRMIQQQLQECFTRLDIDEQRAQQHAQQLAQRIQREQPSQQELPQLLEQAFVQAGASQEKAQQEARRVAPRIQRHITRDGQPGLQLDDDTDQDRDRDRTRDPNRYLPTTDEPSNEMCKLAMKLVGQTVRISGTELEHGDLQAIVAQNIQHISVENPDDRRRDLERNRDREQNRQR